MFDELQSGDVILFSGLHHLHLRQQQITGCPWAQVALVIRLSCVPWPLLFESTKISTCLDVKTGTVVQGVQLVRASERFSSFEGMVALRKLTPALSENLRCRLTCFAEEVHGWPFNDSKWTAARALRRKNRPSNSCSYFCSELAAEAYQRLGLLPSPPEGLSSNNYIPADFSSIFPQAFLPLGAGFRLGEEQALHGALSTADCAGSAGRTTEPGSSLQ
jgi:hypothetical protein